MDVAFDGFTYDERFLILSTPYDFGALGYAFTNYIADPVAWRALFKVPGATAAACGASCPPVDPTLPEDVLFAEDAVQERLQDFHADRRRLRRRAPQRLQRAPARRVVVPRRSHAARRRRRAHQQPARRHGHELRHPRRVQPAPTSSRGSGSTASSEDLLDLYDRQRRTVAQTYLQTQTIENKKNLENKDPAEREAFQADLHAITQDPDRAARLPAPGRDDRGLRTLIHHPRRAVQRERRTALEVPEERTEEAGEYQENCPHRAGEQLHVAIVRAHEVDDAASPKRRTTSTTNHVTAGIQDTVP